MSRDNIYIIKRDNDKVTSLYSGIVQFMLEELSKEKFSYKKDDVKILSTLEPYKKDMAKVGDGDNYLVVIKKYDYSALEQINTLLATFERLILINKCIIYCQHKRILKLESLGSVINLSKKETKSFLNYLGGVSDVVDVDTVISSSHSICYVGKINKRNDNLQSIKDGEVYNTIVICGITYLDSLISASWNAYTAVKDDGYLIFYNYTNINVYKTVLMMENDGFIIKIDNHKNKAIYKKIKQKYS